MPTIKDIEHLNSSVDVFYEVTGGDHDNPYLLSDPRYASWVSGTVYVRCSHLDASTVITGTECQIHGVTTWFPIWNLEFRRTTDATDLNTMTTQSVFSHTGLRYPTRNPPSPYCDADWHVYGQDAPAGSVWKVGSLLECHEYYLDADAPLNPQQWYYALYIGGRGLFPGPIGNPCTGYKILNNGGAAFPGTTISTSGYGSGGSRYNHELPWGGETYITGAEVYEIDIRFMSGNNATRIALNTLYKIQVQARHVP